MYPLFELSRLLSFKVETEPSTSPLISKFAWREEGESNLLALLCSNGYIVLRHSNGGKQPVVRELPWPRDRPVSCLCFDPTVTWLLVVTHDASVFIVPVLHLMDPKAKINQLWDMEDVTAIPFKTIKGNPSAVSWWHSLDGQQLGIIATMAGEVFFLDLLKKKVVAQSVVEDHVVNLELVEDDQLVTAYLLITGKTGKQWKLLLESRSHGILTSPDKELSELGYDQVDGRYLPVSNIISATVETKNMFCPVAFSQFQRSVILSTQNAKGLHFVTAHCDKTSTYQVFDSTIEHLPLFVYKLPLGACKVILTDKLLFSMLKLSGEKTLLVMSSQKSETSVDDHQDFNKDAIVQKFDLPPEEEVIAILKKSFPFYWHEKQEEKLLCRLQEEIQSGVDPGSSNQSMNIMGIRISSHTVLDGCLIITNLAVYECRPRISPERLFLELSTCCSDTSYAEGLGISLSLDVNSLFELAAEYLLKCGNFKQAVRLYQLSKCSQIRRVASFARYGCIQEVMLYLRQLRGNQGPETSTSDRKHLADLALYCYIYQIQCKEDKATPIQTFRDFLMTSFAYDEKLALQLLAEQGLVSLLLELAKARGLVMESLELLAKGGNYDLSLGVLCGLVETGYGTHLAQAAGGAFLRCLTTPDLVTVLCQKPQMAVQHSDMLKGRLVELSIDQLMKLMEIFDPSKPLAMGYLVRQSLTRKRSTSWGSVNSAISELDGPTRDKNVPDAAKIIDFFLNTLLYLNWKREMETGLYGKDLLLLEEPWEGQAHGLDREVDESRRRLACRPSPIGCGPWHVAVIKNGNLYTWGRAQKGRLGNGNLIPENSISPICRVETLHMLQVQVISVACGGEHTAVLTNQGVFCWGSSAYGQVGTGTRHTYTRPMLLDALSAVQCVSVQCGQYHTMALSVEAELYSWGWGVHGQLGHGNIDDCLVPTRVTTLSDKQIISVAVGYCHSVALSSQGSVWTFGSGFWGQLGLGDHDKRSLPTQIESLTEKIVTIATKSFHSVAVSSDNHVYTWGCNPYSLRYLVQMARRARAASETLVDPTKDFLNPQLVDTTYVHGRISGVVCGNFHSLLVTSDGDVYTWGRNLDGQLGNGSRQDLRTPVIVTAINDRQVVHAACGGEYNVVMDTDGQLWGWGKNDYSQILPDKSESTNTVMKHSRSPAIVQDSSHIFSVWIPTAINGLPSSSGQSPWKHSTSLSLSLSNSFEDWVEDSFEDCNVELLPSLDKIGEADYSRNILKVVFDHLPHLCSSVQILRRCVDLKDWLSAACLCVHLQIYPQALVFHLKALTAHREQIQEIFIEASIKVSDYYLKLIKEAQVSTAQREEELRQAVFQILRHWDGNSLSAVDLENFFLPHLDLVAPLLSIFIIMTSELEEQEKTTLALSSKFRQSFSSSFLLKITIKVLAATKEGFEKSSPFCHSVLQETFVSPSHVDLQSSDRLMRSDQIWQDILQNIRKTPDTKHYIYITRSELDHLEEQLAVESDHHGDRTDMDTQSNTVLFTCGHLYTKQKFVEDVLEKFTKELSHGPSKLPETASVLTSYYNRKGLLPMSCPKCVLNALHAIR
ncbi:hypothetical protein ScPMuIL_007685 [Solemya velum]